MMESEWNQEQVINLIDLYRERPVLWDPTNADFKDRNLKNYAWTEIGQALRMTKVEVKNKMTKVIGQFQRECKKQKSGSGTNAKVKWFGYEHLLFLRDKTVPRSTSEVGLERNEVSKITQIIILIYIIQCYVLYNKTHFSIHSV